MVTLFAKKPSASGGAPHEKPSRDLVRAELRNPTGAALLRDARERLPELEHERARILVEGAVERFLLEIMDVGASEAHHHAVPWGLAYHSLEVSVRALRIARSRHFVGHAAPNPEEQERRLPRLRYGCFLLGLYHDLGKLGQIRIKAPGRESYNPWIEPLGDFYDRHGREACTFAWRSGRNLEDHARQTPVLIGRILPPAAAAYIGPEILAELIEGKSPAAREVEEIIREADRHSVEKDAKARKRGGEEVPPGASQAPQPAAPLFEEALGGALESGLTNGSLSTIGLDADLLLGRDHLLVGYPEAVLKILGLAQDRHGAFDIALRKLPRDEEGARFFLAKLGAEGALFVDPATGLWKLRATLKKGGQSRVREVVLVARKRLPTSLSLGAPFAGRITFHRPLDGNEVVIRDFENMPTAEPQKPEAIPAIPQTPVPATLGPRDRIDPKELAAHLLRGMLEKWIPTNVPQGQVYVTPKKTFVVTPAIFLRLREQGLYPEFNPQEKTSAFLNTLVGLDFVEKAKNYRIVYPILLGPESPRPLKVVKFLTPGLFTSQETLQKVGFWKDGERIVELPQGWKLGDAICAPGEASHD